MLADRSTDAALNLRWTFSNALSALRMVLVIPTALAIGAEMRELTVALAILAMITDVLDGYIARRFNEISDLGKILDPLADKVYVGVVAVQMLVLGMVPLWFVAVVLARDLLILLGGLWIERQRGVVLPSNYPGKAAVVSLCLTLLFIVGGMSQGVVEIFMGITLLLLAISLYLYGRRAFKMLGTGTQVASGG